jgi:hypothetical protein
MPDAPRARAAAAVNTFINELRAAFERAGPPTYARLEELSLRLHDPNPAAGPRVLVLAHSTTHDILTGKHVRLPAWPWVSSLIYVLRVAAEENGLDPESIGTTGEWHAKYLEARSAVQQAGRQGPPLAAPTPAAAPSTPIPAAMSSPGTTARDRPGAADIRLPSPYASGSYGSSGGFRRLPTVAEPLRDVDSDRRRAAPTSASASAASAASAAGRFATGGPGDWRRKPHAYRSRDVTTWPLGGAAARPAPAGHGRVTAPVSPPNAVADVDHDTGRAPGRRGAVPPREPTLMWRRYVEAYGRTGTRLLRHAEADEGRAGGVPAYQLATLVACEHRPIEALYWLRRAGRAGHRRADRLARDWDPVADARPPRYWRPADAAYEIGLHYEAGGQPFSAAVFFDSAAGVGHAEAAYRAGLHRMQIGRHWDAMLMFNRAAGAGHEPARRERDGLLARVRRAPSAGRGR